jgi:hypothetical protein
VKISAFKFGSVASNDPRRENAENRSNKYFFMKQVCLRLIFSVEWKNLRCETQRYQLMENM